MNTLPIPDDERISRYLDDDLDAQERMAFEADCRKQPALHTELALMRDSLFLLKAAHPREQAPLSLTLRAMALVQPALPSRSHWPAALARMAAIRQDRSVRGHAAPSPRRARSRWWLHLRRPLK
jgi:anti-sigma factor RsiW